MLHIRCIYFAV